MHPRTAHRLVAAMAALLVADLAGGLLAVSSGVNTWPEAWGSRALLAAPWPMIVVQVALVALAVRLPGRRRAVPATLLALACLVSVASGFFDGGLADDALTPALSAYQVLLLNVTGATGLAAVGLAVEAVRRPGRTAGEPSLSRR